MSNYKTVPKQTNGLSIYIVIERMRNNLAIIFSSSFLFFHLLTLSWFVFKFCELYRKIKAKATFSLETEQKNIIHSKCQTTWFFSLLLLLAILYSI
jgi:hypothetical protein